MIQLNTAHKYSKTAGVTATRSLNDRHWGLAADFALRLLRVLVLVALWRTLLPAKGTVSGMTLESVLTYTLISQAFSAQLSSQNGLDEDLWSGNIANRFLRPMGIHGQIVAEMVGGCVFRSKVATRFGLKWPPNSEQNGHLFRSESGRFLAAAETGGRHVPK